MDMELKKITLNEDFGSHKAGSVITVDAKRADLLVDEKKATFGAKESANKKPRVMERGKFRNLSDDAESMDSMPELEDPPKAPDFSTALSDTVDGIDGE